MSKSIYEEALEKINISFSAWDIAERFELFELIEQALEQAQKQEKLLNQIKDIVNRYYDSYNDSYIRYIRPLLEESNRYTEIVKLIKENENE